MTPLESLEQLYSELHKDVYGVKARWYRAESIEQAQKDLDALEAAGAVIWAEEKAQEERMVIALEARIADIITMGAGDRETALRWIHDAEGTDGDDEFLCYCLGVPYGYFRKSG